MRHRVHLPRAGFGSGQHLLASRHRLPRHCRRRLRRRNQHRLRRPRQVLRHRLRRRGGNLFCGKRREGAHQVVVQQSGSRGHVGQRRAHHARRGTARAQDALRSGRRLHGVRRSHHRHRRRASRSQHPVHAHHGRAGHPGSDARARRQAVFPHPVLRRLGHPVQRAGIRALPVQRRQARPEVRAVLPG